MSRNTHLDYRGYVVEPPNHWNGSSMWIGYATIKGLPFEVREMSESDLRARIDAVHDSQKSALVGQMPKLEKK